MTPLKTPMEQFDYESKMWGGTEVRLSPLHLGASRLKFALEDLRNVKGMDSRRSTELSRSPGSPRKVLEVGCGGGGMAKAIKFYRPNLDVYGIDISEKAISEAKRDSQGVKFSLGDAHKIPFKDQSFDAVVMFDLLEHSANPLKSLQEAHRVLRSRGIFSAFVPIEGNILSIHGLAKRLFGFIPKEKYGGHVQQYTLSELKALLEEAGLRLLRRRYFGHLFNQSADFTYFTLLYLRGKNVPYSVEGYLAGEKGLKRDLIALIKYVIATISYFESEIFWFLPASGVHLTASNAASR